MRAFYIPIAVLILLVSASLITGYYVQTSTSLWIDELHSASELANSGEWETAQHRISGITEDWLRHEEIFHILLEHEDLDETKEVLFSTLAACRETDSVEFQIHVQLLISRLQFLTETQKASLQNLL